MIELVKYLVDELVPGGDYSVAERESEEGVDIVVAISKKDIGKIIGRQGRIAKAVRTLVKAASGRNSVRYNVVIEEKE
jgi:predicted RNA-binding protein YlqC (UPF0109 family)